LPNRANTVVYDGYLYTIATIAETQDDKKEISLQYEIVRYNLSDNGKSTCLMYINAEYLTGFDTNKSYTSNIGLKLINNKVFLTHVLFDINNDDDVHVITATLDKSLFNDSIEEKKSITLSMDSVNYDVVKFPTKTLKYKQMCLTDQTMYNNELISCFTYQNHTSNTAIIKDAGCPVFLMITGQNGTTITKIIPPGKGGETFLSPRLLVIDDKLLIIYDESYDNQHYYGISTNQRTSIG
jgi:hypothetical protein